MFTLVINPGDAQFTITAEDAARYLNSKFADTNRVPYMVYGGGRLTLQNGSVSIVGPALMSRADTLRMLRDNGFSL